MVDESYIVDTSVIVRWFLKQAGWQAARRYREAYLQGRIGMETVECARYELPHVLRSRGLLQRLMTVEEYVAAVRIIDDWGIPAGPLDAGALESSARLAVSRNLRFFDAVFVDRSLSTGFPLLTADVKLANAVDGLVEVEIVADT